MKNLLAFMIMIDPEKVHSFSNPKYAQRYEYAKETFFPLMEKNDIKITTFNAIHPSEIEITDEFVNYKNVKVKRGINPSTGQKINNYEISLAYAHMEICSIGVKENCNVLIFEDDVILKDENVEYTINSIKNFISNPILQEKPSLLYLQSTCPWRQNKPLKFYPETAYTPYDSNFFKLNRGWYDTSGTLAYISSPKCSEALVDYVKEDSMKQSDSLLHQALSSGKIDLYITKNYTNNFELHSTLS